MKYSFSLLTYLSVPNKMVFFEKTRHISWTFLTGYGNPPHDYVSLLVKLVVAIGLGVPAVIILSSGLYVFLKRVSKPKDDLLLGR